jgi:hypothetical protein
MKKLIGSLAALLLVSAPIAATASVINVDFEEFAYGTSIGDYYNHGKDSLNRASGSYYGVTFNGGTIKSTPRGNYLAGGTTVTIDAAAVRALLGTDDYYITFNGGVYYQQDERSVYVTYENGYREPSAYIPGNDSPDCHGIAGCARYYGTMGAYRITAVDRGADAVRIQFPTDRLDNFQIHSMNDTTLGAQSIQGTYDLDRDVPEPASLALFSIGAAGLLARRYRSSRKGGAASR